MQLTPIDKGLVIADPWISHILQGRKLWEMRSTRTSQRGLIGLIRKGSGHVWGVARIIDCRSPLTPEQMLATEDKHRIPAQMIHSGKVAKWNTPWVLADVRPLASPVPYTHPNGAVTWVRLEPTVSEAITRQFAHAA